MKIVFEINTSSAPFTTAYGGLAVETARILEVFAGRLRDLGDAEVTTFSHPLHDELGNRVGGATISP